MADEIAEEVTEEQVVIDPETIAAAKKLMGKRFQFVTDPDATLIRLARLGVRHIAKDMTKCPERYEQTSEPEEPPEVEPLDPLDILRKEHQLPSLPQVFLDLQRAINGKSTSADNLAAIISQDPSLTAFLLRMVNSAFYSLPQPVDTISRAVTVIGVNQLSTLAVGTSVMSLFKDVPAEVLDMEQFWKHSITCGLVARRLCRTLGKGEPERAFVAGLLHDIGLLILLQAEPERAAGVMKHAKAKDVLLWKEEKDLLGFDHATLGGMLLRKWNFPFVLVSAVLQHHEPKREQKEPEAALVHCAETIATALGIGSSGEFFVQPPNPEVWASMNLSPDRMEEMIEDLDEELEEAFTILIDQ